MSFSGTQYGDVSPRVGIFLVAQALEHARPIAVLDKHGKLQELPKNKGLTLKWRRPVPLDVSPVALTEGVTPAPSSMEYDDVSATISQYGGWIPFTDVITDTHEDPVVKDMAELVGEAAITTKEMLIWNTIRGGTNVIYSGVATQRNQVIATVTEDEIRSAQKQLKINHGKYVTKMLSASDKFATEPVAPAFLAFSSTSLESDLRDLSGFVPREKYSVSTSLVSEYEIGKLEDVRFILTPVLEPFYGAGASASSGVENDGSNAHVYPIVVIAQDAYALTPLKGMSSVAVAVKQPKMGESYEDPLGQRGFVSWKMWFVCTRLNEAWMVRIETAASAY